MNLEDRLRTAVRAEADRVVPDETASLGAIRARGRTARRRRRAVGGSLLALVVAGAVALAPRLGGGSGQDVDTIGGPHRSTTTTRPETTETTPATTVTTAPSSTQAPPTSSTTTSAPPEPAPEGAMATVPVLWPGPQHAPFTDPVAAARSFVEEFVGQPAPALSACRCALSAGTGEIDVYLKGEDGQPFGRVASTLSVIRDQDRWYVVGARSADVVIDAPAPSTRVVGQVAVQGRGRGYEGTIHLEVRAAFAPSGQALARATATAGGGGGEELVPFAATLPHGATPGSTGALLATNDTGVTNGTVSFTALPLAFG